METPSACMAPKVGHRHGEKTGMLPVDRGAWETDHSREGGSLNPKFKPLAPAVHMP